MALPNQLTITDIHKHYRAWVWQRRQLAWFLGGLGLALSLFVDLKLSHVTGYFDGQGAWLGSIIALIVLPFLVCMTVGLVCGKGLAFRLAVGHPRVITGYAAVFDQWRDIGGALNPRASELAQAIVAASEGKRVSATDAAYLLRCLGGIVGAPTRLARAGDAANTEDNNVVSIIAAQPTQRFRRKQRDGTYS